MRTRAALKVATLAAVTAALLAGCPLTSDKPLSDPGSAAADLALVGTWNVTDPETGEVNQLRILAFNGREMAGVTAETGSGEITAMRMFPTRIGAETFLNVQELGTSDPAWYLLNYRVDTDTLRMKIVDDGLFKDRRFASSDELRAFVARNLTNPRLYAAADDTPTEMILRRVPQPSGTRGP